jgi:hypothetical protein
MIATIFTAPPAAPGSVTNSLRDIKPPVEIPSGWAWLWWVLGALAIAALLAWLWRYWQKQRAMVPLIPAIPPHVRAKQKLQEALALIGQPREFCILVSDTVRWYLEERFDFHAPERTTEEFLHELQGTNLLTPDQKESLAEFLKRCDLVKFARYEPREPELRDLHESALRLIEETEPPSTPPDADTHHATRTTQHAPHDTDSTLQSVERSQIPTHRDTPHSALRTPHSHHSALP